MQRIVQRALTGLCALAAVVSWSGTAHAAQFLYTITGTVTGDELTYDEWHIFDPEQGQAFTARFLVDDAAPSALYSYDATGSRASGGGLTQIGTRSPLSASLTIGSRTYDIRSGDFRQYPVIDPISGDPVGPTDLVNELGLVAKDAALGSLSLSGVYSDSHECCFPHPNDTYSQGDALEFTLRSAAFTDPDFRQTGTFALTSSGGYFSKSETIVAWPGALSQILLTANVLTVAQVSAVPEIGTWLMMMFGVGTVGWMARSGTGRKRLSSQAALWDASRSRAGNIR
jgi:hypothetical protein